MFHVRLHESASYNFFQLSDVAYEHLTRSSVAQMDGVASEPKIVLAPICFHHLRFHGHILGAELGFKEERGATHPGHLCIPYPKP